MEASLRPCTVGAIIISSLQMGELRPRKVKLLAQDYTEFAPKLSSLYAYLSHLAPSLRCVPRQATGVTVIHRHTHSFNSEMTPGACCGLIPGFGPGIREMNQTWTLPSHLSWSERERLICKKIMGPESHRVQAGI